MDMQHCQEKPTVLLIGQGEIPVQCADALIKLGFDIAGLHSPDEPLRDWAKRRNHPNFFSDFRDFERSALSSAYDYLFSVVNFIILKPELLRSPRCLAINYHDGPLPRYAGSNAIAWALYNGETTHGVTWHVMEESVDAGDILKQVNFAIKPGDTHHSVQLKCYLAAMRAFRELLLELKDGTYTRTRQDLSKRTFYRRSQVPPQSTP
jgi:methionyl-tRNA formyltransferase